MYIALSDDKHQMVRDSSKNTLASVDVIVTQLLRYHMPLLYFVCNHLIYLEQDRIHFQSGNKKLLIYFSMLKYFWMQRYFAIFVRFTHYVRCGLIVLQQLWKHQRNSVNGGKTSKNSDPVSYRACRVFWISRISGELSTHSITKQFNYKWFHGYKYWFCT